MMREVWTARVRNAQGQYERATLSVDESGVFVLDTANAATGSSDRAVIDHDDAVRLAEVLEEELHSGPTS